MVAIRNKTQVTDLYIAQRGYCFLLTRLKIKILKIAKIRMNTQYFSTIISRTLPTLNKRTYYAFFSYL